MPIVPTSPAIQNKLSRPLISPDRSGLLDIFGNTFGSVWMEGATGFLTDSISAGLSTLDDAEKMPWDVANDAYALTDTPYAYSKDDGMVYRSMARRRDAQRAWAYASDLELQKAFKESPVLGNATNLLSSLTAGILDPVAWFVGGFVGRGMALGTAKALNATKIASRFGDNAVVGALSAKTARQYANLSRTQQRIRNAFEVGVGVTAVDLPAFVASRHLYGRDVEEWEAAVMMAGSMLMGYALSPTLRSDLPHVPTSTSVKRPLLGPPDQTRYLDPPKDPVTGEVLDPPALPPGQTRLEGPPYIEIEAEAVQLLGRYGDRIVEAAEKHLVYTKVTDRMGKNPDPGFLDDLDDTIIYTPRDPSDTIPYKYDPVGSPEIATLKDWYGSFREGEEVPTHLNYHGVGTVELVDNPVPKNNVLSDLGGKGDGVLFKTKIHPDLPLADQKGFYSLLYVDLRDIFNYGFDTGVVKKQKLKDIRSLVSYLVGKMKGRTTGDHHMQVLSVMDFVKDIHRTMLGLSKRVDEFKFFKHFAVKDAFTFANTVAYKSGYRGFYTEITSAGKRHKSNGVVLFDPAVYDGKATALIGRRGVGGRFTKDNLSPRENLAPLEFTGDKVFKDFSYAEVTKVGEEIPGKISTKSKVVDKIVEERNRLDDPKSDREYVEVEKPKEEEATVKEAEDIDESMGNKQGTTEDIPRPPKPPEGGKAKAKPKPEPEGPIRPPGVDDAYRREKPFGEEGPEVEAVSDTLKKYRAQMDKRLETLVDTYNNNPYIKAESKAEAKKWMDKMQDKELFFKVKQKFQKCITGKMGL